MPWNQQDSCEVSWRSIGNSRIAVKSLGCFWDQQFSCEVSRKSLGTSSIAVEFSGIVWA